MSEIDIPTDVELEEVIMMGVEKRLIDVNVCLPGIVEDYDAETGFASVQPALQRNYLGKLVNLPVIQKVPVVFPRAGTWSVSGPIAKGDTGELRFVQRSIDIWKTKGGIVDPMDPRKFHISDAVFYPGLSPSTKPVGNPSKHLRLKNGSAQVEIQDGKFKIEKIGGDEFLDLVVQLMTQVSMMADKLGTDKTNTSLGPQPLLAAADYVAVKSAVDALKGKLSGIKG